jgi:hypothetical protein
MTHLALAEDPEITTQPTNQVVSPGGTTQFRVTATTAEYPLTYQWQRTAFNLAEGFTNLPGATSTLLRFTSAVAEQAGDYRAIAANASGHSVTSQVARLTIDPTFVCINEGPGGTDAAGSVGTVWADYDADGYPDLFICNASDPSSSRNVLWHNNKDGSFTKITTGRPVLDLGAWWYPYWIDYDNDGDLDLHVLAGGSGTDKFYRNDGNGLFTPATPEFVKTDPYGYSWGEMISWSDFNNDGWLDVFIPRNDDKHKDLFFRGDAGGLFRSLTAKDVGSIVDDWSYFVGANFDYDNDGWQDLLVPPFSWSTPNLKCRLYHNAGYGFFHHITEGDLANQYSTFPDDLGVFPSAGDYDNDGDLDLFVGGGEDGYGGRLYRNDGSGNFTNVAAEAGVDVPLNGFFTTWGDYDNDGNLDLLICSTIPSAPQLKYGNDSVMFHNNGDGTFTSVEIGSPLRDGARKFAYTWVDYDHDGFLDLFIAAGNAERNHLYHNNLPSIGNKNHWLKVRLVGKASNSMGVGAKVRVTATIRGKTVQQLREITVPGTMTQEDYLAHFGLGDATKVDLVQIEWPSGIVQKMTNVVLDPAKPYMTVTETQDPDPLPQPQVLAFTPTANGAFQATVKSASQAKQLHVLEASTDLTQWIKKQVRTNLTGTMEFFDASATNAAARFYRVVVP